jgi:hypothetical protein
VLEAGQGGREEPPSPRRLPEPRKVWLEPIEDEPVALGEVPPARAIEQERLGVPERRGDRDVELVLDAFGLEPELVQARVVQLSA